MSCILNVWRTLCVLILYASTFFLQDKVVWVCSFSSWHKFKCVCAWRRSRRADFKTASDVLRMNVDELGLQQHERGFVTFCLTPWRFTCCHVLGHIRTESSMFTWFLFLSIPQVTMEFGLDKRAQTLQGLAFPLQEEAKRALQQLKQRRINYIQLVSPDRKPLGLITKM